MIAEATAPVVTSTIQAASADLNTYYFEFPGKPLDENWFTAAYEMTSGIEWSDYWVEVNRLEYFHAGGGIAHENAALSIGSDLLPNCARLVRDGGRPTPAYWSWLTSQLNG